MSKYKDKINKITEQAIDELEAYADYMECAELYKDDIELHELYIDLAMAEKNHFMQLHNRVGKFFKDMYERGEKNDK